MKVLVTCEKCGAVQLDYFCTTSELVQVRSCDECAHLAYGPITEEMMVEALIACSHAHDDVEDDYYTAEARFVLRMLKDGALAKYEPTVTATCTAESWLKWLLELARQP